MMIALCMNGIILPKRAYLSRHLVRLMPHLARAVRPHCARNPARVLRWGGFRGKRLTPPRLRRLVGLAAGNPYSNTYHHPCHTMTVVLNAALLAERARLGDAGREMLLLAALCHDLGHRGKRASRVPFVEEKRTARLATRLGFATGSSQGREVMALMRHIESTAADWHALPIMDEITALLRDADIMASVFYPRPMALHLSGSVMRERGMGMTSAHGLDGFLKLMAKRGFGHGATKRLAGVMSAQTLGVGHRPATARKLGFRAGRARARARARGEGA